MLPVGANPFVRQILRSGLGETVLMARVGGGDSKAFVRNRTLKLLILEKDLEGIRTIGPQQFQRHSGSPERS
jgi:hypothetical protein